MLATYGSEFYKGTPALTANSVGKGQAYYIASRTTGKFHDDFYRALMEQLGLQQVSWHRLPDGVTAQVRDGWARSK